MKELIVVTYKLPADALMRKLYGDDLESVYDCTAFWDNELAVPEIKKLERKYDEVESFVCDFAAYNDWVDNKTAWAEFVRTGVCPLKPIKEDVDVGTSSKTVTIECDVKIEREDPNATFEYQVDIDDVGQIVFTPYDVGTRFCHSGEDVVEGENVKFETVRLTAQMVSESGNYDYFTGTDDVGQFVITPDVEDTSFLTVSVDDSLNLVTEDTDSIVVDPDENYLSPFDVGDRVVVQFNGNNCSGEIIEFVNTDPMDVATGVDSGEFAAWIVRFDDGTQEMIGQQYMTLENVTEGCKGNNMKVLKEANKYRDFEWDQTELYAVVKNDGRYAGRPCISYGEAQNMAANHDGSKIFKLVLEDDPTEEPLEESVSDTDRMNIVNRVMKGDLPIYEESGEPSPDMIHLEELDSAHGPVVYEYYYDEASDSVVSYMKQKG